MTTTEQRANPLDGYDIFDPFDLGDLDQRGSIATRYGTKDELLRMVFDKERVAAIQAQFSEMHQQLRQDSGEKAAAAVLSQIR